MSSYGYTKIEDSQPERYDRGIAFLSLGAADRSKKKLVEENVRPGSHVLEIECGTETIASLAPMPGERALPGVGRTMPRQSIPPGRSTRADDAVFRITRKPAPTPGCG